MDCCTTHTADRWVREVTYGYRAEVVGGARQVEWNPRSSMVVGNNGSKYYTEVQGFAQVVDPETTTYFNLHQKIPGVNTLSGKSATLSFWAKGSHNDGEDNLVYIGLKQDFGTNWSKREPISGGILDGDVVSFREQAVGPGFGSGS